MKPIHYNTSKRAAADSCHVLSIISIVYVFSDVVRVSSERCAHHVTKHNTPIHNILWTAPQLSISQKALGTLPEDGNVMPKHVGTPIHINKLNE
jgi:hypothetical protein